jgi:hypothetical protein
MFALYELRDDDQGRALVAEIDDWHQIVMVQSPGNAATIEQMLELFVADANLPERQEAAKPTRAGQYGEVDRTADAFA